MEFSSRGFQRSPQPAASSNSTAPQQSDRRPVHKKAMHKLKESKSVAILWVVFFASIAILIIAVIFSLSARGSESGLVNKKGYQAVFLENGQAYFGKIKDINSSYIDLRDIYYLYNGSADGQNTSQNLSLVKLGTELHCPEDRMVIYRNQVTFWENINDSGKVVTAINDWKKQNPNGQKCSEANQQSTQQQSTSPQQPTTENQSSQNKDSQSSDGNQPSSNNNSSNDSQSNSNTPDDGEL